MNYSKIKLYLSQKNMTIKDLATEIDMTEAGFYAMFKNQTLSVKKMEMIAEILGISPCEFFENNAHHVSEPAPIYGPNQHLSEKIIETQNKVIDLLTRELDRCREELKKNDAG